MAILRTISQTDIKRLKALIREREPDAYFGDFFYEIEFIVRHPEDENPEVEVWVQTDIVDSKSDLSIYHHYWRLHPDGQWQKDDE